MTKTTTNNSEEHTPDRLLTIEEVAHATGLSVSRLHHHRKKGHPLYSDKAVRAGGTPNGKLMWKQSDVTAWIKNLPYTPAGTTK